MLFFSNWLPLRPKSLHNFFVLIARFFSNSFFNPNFSQCYIHPSILPSIRNLFQLPSVLFISEWCVCGRVFHLFLRFPFKKFNHYSSSPPSFFFGNFKIWKKNPQLNAQYINFQWRRRKNEDEIQMISHHRRPKNKYKYKMINYWEFFIFYFPIPFASI